MDSRRIIPIEAVGDADCSLVGAKGMGLARLMRAGLPVPAAFCITSTAFREHLDAHGLWKEITSGMRRAAAAAPDKKRVLLKELREKISGAPLADDLCEEIGKHLHALGAGIVAVRSSATAEDLPGRSFAGQYHTYLGISDLAGCLEAVGKCWASLWTERAFDYRERNGLHHMHIDMAVIVQELIPAEASGVIFTADPMTGATQRLTVEAVFGLGETLVSGKASPDRYILDRRSLRVVSSTASVKAVQRVVNAHGRVEERALDPPRAASPCIDEAVARQLGRLALKAESALGIPQDVEWARRGGRLYLLQSRPITALPARRSWEDRQVWSNVNTGEVMPDVVTPISWSLAQMILDQIFGSIFGRLGVDFGDHPLAGQVAGRAYFNLNTLVGALSCIPGAGKIDVVTALGGGRGEVEDVKDVVIPDEDIPDLDFNLRKALVKVPSFFLWFFSNSLRKGESLVADLKVRFSRLLKEDFSSLDDDRLLSRMNYIRDTLGETDDIIGIAARSMYYFMTLDKMCRRWFDEREGISANLLCSGLEGMDSAEAGFELWRLALEAHGHPDVEAALLSGIGFAACRKKISRQEGGGEFLGLWDGFMASYGHHTRGELEVFNPRWLEDPDGVLDMLRGYLRGVGRMDPLQQKRSNARRRVEMTVRCQGLLRDPVRRWLFRYFLKQAQLGLVLRENIKSEAVRCMTVIRGVLLELGQRLVARGVLESEGDVFFLYLEEVEPVLHGRSGPGIREKVASRRAEYERNIVITPPRIIYGRFDPDDFVPDPVDMDAEVLTGLAVSPGVVTGPARVMLREDSGQIEPGEIMVAPFTDPGWTPHFLTAAAIVMDMGGLLSHGSIVAREYGIPTVVNVGPATRIIKTGQTIQVDGDRGIVRIFH